MLSLRKRHLFSAGVLLLLVFLIAAGFIWYSLKRQAALVKGIVLHVSPGSILLYERKKGLTSFAPQGVKMFARTGEFLTPADIRPGNILLLSTEGIVFGSEPTVQAKVYGACVTGQAGKKKLDRLFTEYAAYLPKRLA